MNSTIATNIYSEVGHQMQPYHTPHIAMQHFVRQNAPPHIVASKLSVVIYICAQNAVVQENVCSVGKI